jgi:hypothetical protein
MGLAVAVRVGFAREAQDSFAEMVALDLVGAAGDRERR